MTGMWVLHDYNAKVMVERTEDLSRVTITVNGKDVIQLSTHQAQVVMQALDLVFNSPIERKVTYGR